jgi:putative addiction module component (TIGR02574 family)
LPFFGKIFFLHAETQSRGVKKFIIKNISASPRLRVNNNLLTTKELIEEAVSLPVEDRVMVADSILRSLNAPESDIDREWMAVAQRRSEELRSGQVKPIPGEQVFARVSQRFIAVMHLHRDPDYWKHRLG